ncbi:MAG: hypothetical protein ABJE47_06030 [bacterium]
MSVSSSEQRSRGIAARATQQRISSARREVVGVWRITALVAIVALCSAQPLAAQRNAGNGFLFREPEGSFQIRAGYSGANASSDLFAFTTDQLTLNKSSFSGATIGAEFSFRIAPQLDLSFSADYAGVSPRSEFRHLVDQDNQPIEQTTEFRRVPLIASMRAYLTPRGRSIGHFVWIPSKFTPWVEAGGGFTWFQFRQQGDFVDFKTNDVFTATSEANGWAPSASGAVGGDISLNARLALTGAARYTYAKGTLSSDFTGFNNLDLSGVSTTVGLTVRF